MLAVVPARGGSKGLARKNLRPLAGRPLIVHTLDCAKAVPAIDRIIVTTDDEEIAAACKTEGVEVPFRRPAELASDDAAAVDVYLHTVDWLTAAEGEAPDQICVLLPTSPLRLASDVEGAIALFRDRRAEVVLSVTGAKPIAWHQKIEADGRLVPIDATPPREAIANRQELRHPMVLNGSIYVLDIEALRRTRSYFGARTYGYAMPADRSIDIDDEIDLRMAEALIAGRTA